MMMNHSPASEITDATDTYPATRDRATLSLTSLLHNLIEQQGPIPFDQWMQHCLYHPELGYYNRGGKNVGREGDFFTSISVGRCFGMLLAHRIIAYVEEHTKLERLDLLELGANTGQLALDILETLVAEAPHIYRIVHYSICEPLSTMQKTQKATLAKHADKIHHFSHWGELAIPFEHAIILSNELVDAFPVKLIQKKQQGWVELYVENSTSEQGAGFRFTEQALSSTSLQDFTQALPDGLPEGYTTEFRPGINEFTSQCRRALKQGLVITIDYGFTADDYYNEQRSSGTLRTYFEHKAGEDPLVHVGAQDITAHVDFTQLSRSFEAVGLELSYFDTQSRYLTQHATRWFQKIEQSASSPPSKLIRQFQTLTHPSMMGRQFHVLECRQHPPR